MAMNGDTLHSKEYIDLDMTYGAHNYQPLPVVISKAEGVWVWDPEGRQYMDMLSAYSAINHGHRHPRILAALSEQMERVTLTSRAFHNDRMGLFLKKLTEVCGMDMALPMNTGAEAVETAIKAARKWGYKVKAVPEGRAEIIVFNGNFHGRTTTIVGFSSEEQYRDGFGPFTPGFRLIDYGDIGELITAVNNNTVAILIEPIQGEGGIVVPPAGFLRQVRETCDVNDVLMVADEIQTGLCRTGDWFACQHENVKPDMMILGKALGGGLLPVSAVVSSKEILGVFNPGDHGSTFGGYPLASAVGHMALTVLEEENLATRAKEMGGYFM
ncbi:ornithine--oxo-acid transaminase, partial [bacterium]|nr:ornithine--oxo-acid transaminase [candidate division CSSED10-310 bacterium]